MPFRVGIYSRKRITTVGIDDECPSILFAISFDTGFCSATVSYSHNEIPLFRALHNTFGLGCKFHVEEYHGDSRRVTFAGNGSYARTFARCELSDLMITTYSSKRRSIRLTYLQAKSERALLLRFVVERFRPTSSNGSLFSQRPTVKPFVEESDVSNS